MTDEFINKSYCKLQHDNTNENIKRIHNMLEENSRQTEKIYLILRGNGVQGLVERVNVIDSKVDKHIADSVEERKTFKTIIYKALEIGVIIVFGGGMWTGAINLLSWLSGQ